MKPYVNYPRGFIAPAFDEQAQRDDILKHPLVETLHQTMTVEPTKVHTFEFHEQILKLAKEVFENPKSWLELQRQSPSFNNRHIDFLKEVVAFISKGEKRLSFHTWKHLLTGSVDHKQRTVNKVVLNEKAWEELTKDWNSVLGIYKNNPVTLLQNWTSQANGYHHLLMTLYVILGEDNSLVKMESVVYSPGK